MPISELVWPEDRVEHIAEHGVTPEEFEEGLLRTVARRLPDEGHRQEPGVLRAWRDRCRRHVFCVVIEFPRSKGYPVTARDMTHREKRRYAEWKRR